jgi:gas vesicle protein
MSEVPTPTMGASGPAPPSAASGQDGNGSQGATDQAKEKAQQAAGQAQEKAQEAAGQAKSRAREEIDRRSTEAGEQVASTASDLRSVGEQLREQGKDTPAKLADQAADRVEQVGGYLKDADSDRILSDVEDLARRQPWVVVAGGIALGFAAARFLKASSSQRYQQRQSSVGSGSAAGSSGGRRPELGRTAVPQEGIGNAGQPYVDPGTGAAPLTTGVTPATATGH